MKTNPWFRLAPAILTLLCLIAAGNSLRGQSVPFTVRFWYPTNGQVYQGPANIGIHAQVLDSNLVTTVQYFSGTTNIEMVTNTGGLWLTNTTSPNPFFLLWSNVQGGNYTLTAA